ncbi:MAG: DMT family transporter [Pseudomonadota bacterium]
MTGQRKGALFIVIASIFAAMTTLIAKILGTGETALSPFQITWGRYTFAMMALAIFYFVRRPKFEPLHIPLHLGRVAFGVSGVTAMFAAATLIPLADATAISFLNPMFAMAFAALMLRERVGPVRWFMAALALIGALFLIRPGATSFQPAGLIALLAALLIGIEATFVKALSGREPVFQILLMSNLVGSTLCMVLMIWFWQWPMFEQWLLLIAIGLAMLSAQSLYVPALRMGDASFVMPFSYITLVFAALYDLVLFGVIPVPLSLFGCVIIIVSGVILAWRDGKAKAQ